ncbi:hypothetical protein BaRGS_00027422 [Batillaria attramentaria]|uniref:Uncharacterized protein n=1 Tax=Batillaria attramentaria TaxID=370345 RepID=A0ABD0K1T7_9CAEN
MVAPDFPRPCTLNRDHTLAAGLGPLGKRDTQIAPNLSQPLTVQDLRRQTLQNKDIEGGLREKAVWWAVMRRSLLRVHLTFSVVTMVTQLLRRLAFRVNDYYCVILPTPTSSRPTRKCQRFTSPGYMLNDNVSITAT